MTPRRERHLTAGALALLTVVVSAATAPGYGISRDESVYFVAGEAYATWWKDFLRSPFQSLAHIENWWGVNHEHPGLAKSVFGLSHAVVTDLLHAAGHAQGFRFGAFLFGALLTYVLSLLGRDLLAEKGSRAARFGAVASPLLFWLGPRYFFHAHIAVFDMPVTALWLATVYAYWRSLGHKDERVHLRWAVATGLLFGAAISVKLNGLFLPPLLVAHWLATRGAALFRGSLRDRLKALPFAFPAMAVLGPVIFVLTWPWLWHDTVARTLDYLRFHLHHENYSWTYFGAVLRHPPFPVAYPFVITALTVPAGILAAMAGGLVHSVARLAESLRSDVGAYATDELLWILNALFPIVLIALPSVPIFGGVKHWMPAMPFLAALGARALWAAANQLWPRANAAVAGALLLLCCVPAAWACAHDYPFGTASYNELAGGAAGAATMGQQRQFWGDDMVAALPALNAHAAPNARVWWQEATYDAVREYQRDGRLRADLQWANGPEDAQVVVYHYHQEFRDKEFATWTAFRTERPVDGVYLDEVPLIEVYARPGAWR